MTRLPAGAAALLAGALSSGCAAIYARGLVANAQGQPIGGATVRVVDPRGAVVAATSTDAHGCFLFNPRAPGGERHFTLEVGAPEFQTARFPISLSPPILLAALVQDGAAATSAIRPATTQERAGVYTPTCVPASSPGASQLTPD
ncbi:MAG TPA: carboxypeptidase-like regulatory domain-containing protein [Thermoanaerobaculia bacterium]|nr:carboxypeptidase-like regulatory domain-containing protein [Thermoanaerobaculia bacterium]